MTQWHETQKENNLRRLGSVQMLNCNCNYYDPLRKKRGVTIKKPMWLHRDLLQGQIFKEHVKNDGKRACSEGL